MEFFIIIILFCIYFLPAIIANMKGHSSENLIAMLNLCFGWTLIGWLLCLGWAMDAKKA